MTANIRTSIEQKITPIIPSFSTSDMHVLKSTIELNGNTVSRFRLFYRMIGIDDKQQDTINGKSAAEQRSEYGKLISKFITDNSEAMTKGTKKDPPKKRMDNIGRKKLFEIMKKYLVINPNDPRFNLESEQKQSESKLDPQVVEGPALAQVDEGDDDDLPDDDLSSYFGSAEEKQDQLEAKGQRLQVAIEKYKDLVDKKRALDQFRSQSKLFGLAESKRLLSEKKSETKAQARKTIANKLKQYKQKLKEESIAEAKAIAQAKREEKARKAQEKKSVFSMGTSDILRAQQATQPQRLQQAPIPTVQPEEKKQTVFNMGLNDLLASAPAPRVTQRVAPALAVIPPLVSTPAPAPAPQAEAVLEQPQEVKQRPRPNISGLLKRQQERKEKRQVKEAMTKMKAVQPRTRADFIAEQEQQFIQAGLEVDADEKQQQREDRLEKELEQAQQIQEQPQQVQRVSREQKEQEVILPPARTRMSDYLLQQVGGATFSALSSVLARTAARTGNSDLGGYSAAIGGIAGSAIYNSAMRLYPDLFNNIIADVNEYFGLSPQDIIKEAKSTPPQGPQGPQGPPQSLVEDVKAEGKYDSGPARQPILTRDSTPEEIDAWRVSQGQPPANRGAMARLRGFGGAASAYVEDAVARKYNEVKSSLDPQRYDEKGRGTKYDIRGNLIRYDENGNRLNTFYLGGDPNEDIFLDDDVQREPPLEYTTRMRDRPSRIREAIERSKRVLRTTVGELNDIDPLNMNEREQRLMNDARTRNAIVGGSAIAGAGLVGAGIVGGMNKQQPRIKENPLIFKQEQTTQGDGETNVERGAGKLKPKFIVPSANIFSKTEQEQYVDDMEFAMFDFVQDEGGNDPFGTNPILRDQHMTENLRYQRSGVNVYSLYGANLPDNPRNMPAKKMQEMFLGENRLPEMKFLFSNEFEAQEFNQSEFEVDEYDVNNERTAIEAFSPYANFTNNQLLDQFYDTSILYGVVP
jgi:hypothetical protein